LPPSRKYNPIADAPAAIARPRVTWCAVCVASIVEVSVFVVVQGGLAAAHSPLERIVLRVRDKPEHRRRDAERDRSPACDQVRPDRLSSRLAASLAASRAVDACGAFAPAGEAVRAVSSMRRPARTPTASLSGSLEAADSSRSTPSVTGGCGAPSTSSSAAPRWSERGSRPTKTPPATQPGETRGVGSGPGSQAGLRGRARRHVDGALACLELEVPILSRESAPLPAPCTTTNTDTSTIEATQTAHQVTLGLGERRPGASAIGLYFLEGGKERRRASRLGPGSVLVNGRF